MTATTTAPTSVHVPDHVPQEVVIDFDIFSPVGEGDVHDRWLRLQDCGPIVWTPRNGGHWIATRGVDLVAIQKNHDVFSYRSINIPSNPTPSLPLEIDPPEHTPLRAIISKLFEPQTIAKVEPLARGLAVSLIEELQPRGECEFQREFARHLPITVFLSLVDLPMDGRDHLLDLAEKRTRSPVAEERNAAKAGLLAYMRDAIEERRKSPRDDFISRILHGMVGARSLTDFEAENMLATTLSGGLDTVASMMGFAMLRLAERPDLQRRIVADPSVIPTAVDEIIRRDGLANTARLITRDFDFHGVTLKEGDRLVVPSSLIGLDPEIFEHPRELDFDRSNTGQHGSFGNGPHRCPGANLGRLEIRILLQEWFKRIPSFHLTPGGSPVTLSGMVNTIRELHLSW
jgi:cytochrome P450